MAELRAVLDRFGLNLGDDLYYNRKAFGPLAARHPAPPPDRSAGKTRMLRYPFSLAVLSLLMTPALAQNASDRQPLPVVPPPPPEMAPFDAALEPEVTIRKREGDTVEEHRIKGKLYMIKVTPRKGPPYYLVDTDGDGNLETRRGELNEDLLIPSWTLMEWK